MKISIQRYLLITFFILIGLFSIWLMFHTFSVDSRTGDLLISTKVYSDFGAHIPLIRSFSTGSNWPPVHPLFSGEPIKYHFLFYLVIGLMERVGLRLDLALNIISAIGLFSLCSLIFIISRRFFNSTAVGVLSVIFFLFNGSFSFVDYFKSHPFSSDFFSDLIHNSIFPSFAPWNNSLISAFWNLNIYTNQRHLAASFAITLLIIYLQTYRPAQKIFPGVLLGSLLLINQAAFLIAAIFCLHHFVFNRQLSIRYLLWLSVGFIPWLYLYLWIISPVTVLPEWDPGYLVPSGTSLPGFIHYWLLNFGLHLFFIPLGLIFAPPKLRSYWLPLLLIFILPNTFRFSPDMVNNHKLFNFFLIFGSMFSAGLISRIWTEIPWARYAIVALTPFLVLGGVIDFFPVLNDYPIRIHDISRNPDIKFIQENTPGDSVFLNDTWFYHPASLAGRRLFNGYPYFTWSYGYDQVAREDVTLQIYDSISVANACRILLFYNIDYVQIGEHPEGFLKSTNRSWLNVTPVEYSNPTTGTRIYSVADICTNHITQ